MYIATNFYYKMYTLFKKKFKATFPVKTTAVNTTLPMTIDQERSAI